MDGDARYASDDDARIITWLDKEALPFMTSPLETERVDGILCSMPPMPARPTPISRIAARMYYATRSLDVLRPGDRSMVITRLTAAVADLLSTLRSDEYVQMVPHDGQIAHLTMRLSTRDSL